jgi:hypothetical protein
MAQIENLNPLKHGAFAEAVILPGEDPKEFEELLASLIGIPRGRVKKTKLIA